MMTLRYDTFMALQQQGVVHGGDIEEEMLAREKHWAQVNAARRQTESEYGTYEKHGVSTVDIENNANGVDLDSRQVAQKDTVDVRIDVAGSATADDAAALESSDLLIAHEAIHQHHERRLSQQLLQRQAMAGGKLLVRRKARNILKKSKLFSGFSMAVVTQIVEKMQLRKFPTGTRICIQNDEGKQGKGWGGGGVCDAAVVLTLCCCFLFFLFVAAHEFYILIAGTVKVHRHDPEMGEFALDTELCTLGPFDCFGTSVVFVLLVVQLFCCSCCSNRYDDCGCFT